MISACRQVSHRTCSQRRLVNRIEKKKPHRIFDNDWGQDHRCHDGNRRKPCSTPGGAGKPKTKGAASVAIDGQDVVAPTDTKHGCGTAEPAICACAWKRSRTSDKKETYTYVISIARIPIQSTSATVVVLVITQARDAPTTGKEDGFVVEDFMAKLLERTTLHQLEMAIQRFVLPTRTYMWLNHVRLSLSFVQRFKVASERLRCCCHVHWALTSVYQRTGRRPTCSESLALAKTIPR